MKVIVKGTDRKINIAVNTGARVGTQCEQFISCGKFSTDNSTKD